MKIKKYSRLNGFDAEEEFTEDYLFASALLEYVNRLPGGTRWFIEDCIERSDDEYWATFKSYSTPEYRNFILSVHITRADCGWIFTVGKQVTELA